MGLWQMRGYKKHAMLDPTLPITFLASPQNFLSRTLQKCPEALDWLREIGCWPLIALVDPEPSGACELFSVYLNSLIQDGGRPFFTFPKCEINIKPSLPNDQPSFLILQT